MINGFDRIVVAVPDPDGALADCRLLLGAPGEGADRTGRYSGWLALANTVIQLVQAPPGGAGIRGLVLADPDEAEADRPLANALGLDLSLCDGSASADCRQQAGGLPRLSVDHLVLRTTDAEACIRLFSQQLGIRLALDRDVPEWGGRMLFFRAGKLTLEVIEPASQPPQADHFWGIAYRCANIEEEAARLRERGVELSAIRAGRKSGTRVATVKSHCLGIPTLLIGPAT